MCVDPGTLAVIALATTAASTAYTGYTQVKQAEYQEGVAKTNAVYADRQAVQAGKQTEDQLQAHYRQVAQLRGQQQVSMAASGLDTSFGTPLDLLADTTVGANADAARIAENGINEQQGFLIGAQNERAQAAGSAYAAKSAAFGTVLSTGATLIGGAGRVGETFGKYGAPKWTGSVGKSVAKAYKPA